VPADPTSLQAPADPPEPAVQEPRVPTGTTPPEPAPPPEPPSEAPGPDGWANWRPQRANAPSAGAVEFAGYTDAQLLEEQVDLGPCRLLNTFGVAARQPGRVPLSLVVRMERHGVTDARVGSWEVTNTATWHGGGLDDEFAALVSLALGIRLQSGGLSRLFDPGGDARGRPVHYDHVPPYLPPPRRAPLLPTITGPARLGEAAERLAGYPELTAAQANALVKAARAWQEAVWVADADPRQAWLRLVGALEAAAVQWHRSDRSPEEQLVATRPRLAHRLQRDAPAELYRWVAKDLAGVFKAADKFIDFTMAHLPDPPAVRPPEGFQVGWDRMTEHLAAVYEWRSRDLHDGTPIPEPMCEPPHRIDAASPAPSEVPLGVGTRRGNATWVTAGTSDTPGTPMLLHTFAYIVRSALLKGLATMTTPTTTVTDGANTTEPSA
jgi:hypothetical protein